MNKIICLFICLFSNFTWAGGESWLVNVQEVIVEQKYKFIKLNLLEESSDSIDNCQTISVRVIRQKLSFFSWIKGFLYKNIPTPKETLKSIEYITTQFLNSSKIYFGYIGGGLYKVPHKKCLFESKGLKLEIYNKKYTVYSFFE